MTEQATSYLSTRIAPEIMGKITKLAETERRPVSAMARILLEEALDARGKSKKKAVAV